MNNKGQVSKSLLYRKCAVPGCKSLKTNGISLHLPPKNIELKKKWMYMLGITESNSKKIYFTCSLHFTEDSFYKVTEKGCFKKLKPDAYPTLNVPNSYMAIKSDAGGNMKIEPQQFQINNAAPIALWPIKKDDNQPIGIFQLKKDDININIPTVMKQDIYHHHHQQQQQEQVFQLPNDLSYYPRFTKTKVKVEEVQQQYGGSDTGTNEDDGGPLYKNISCSGIMDCVGGHHRGISKNQVRKRSSGIDGRIQVEGNIQMAMKQEDADSGAGQTTSRNFYQTIQPFYETKYDMNGESETEDGTEMDKSHCRYCEKEKPERDLISIYSKSSIKYDKVPYATLVARLLEDDSIANGPFINPYICLECSGKIEFTVDMQQRILSEDQTINNLTEDQKDYNATMKNKLREIATDMRSRELKLKEALQYYLTVVKPDRDMKGVKFNPYKMYEKLDPNIRRVHWSI